jgi:hypothetical protein
VWQALHESLSDQGLTIITVAMDADPEAARLFIEDAGSTHLSLIDRDHVVAGIFNMVNVPQAVWIDEDGRVVRPVETAGMGENFRDGLDRKTGTMAPEAVAKNDAIRETYLAALRDWSAKGSASRHVLNAAQARARVALPDANVEEAHVHFRLAQALLRRDRADEAAAPVEQARALHPGSWTIWRQTAAKNPRGLASHPEFFARVDAAPPGGFYAPVDMDGMPE